MTDRVPEPGDGDERDLLLGWLAFHRNALETKCAGLTDDQLVDRSAPPSLLSLLGLVRHLSEMERGLKEPSSEMIAAVAGALDVTLCDLTLEIAERLSPVSTARAAQVSAVPVVLALAA